MSVDADVYLFSPFFGRGKFLIEFHKGILAVCKSPNNGILAYSYASLEEFCTLIAFSTVDEYPFKAFYIEKSWQFALAGVHIELILREFG